MKKVMKSEKARIGGSAKALLLKFRRVTIRGAQPSARQRVLGDLCGVLFKDSAGSPQGSAGVCGGPRDFPRVVTLSLSPWRTVGLTF